MCRRAIQKSIEHVESLIRQDLLNKSEDLYQELDKLKEDFIRKTHDIDYYMKSNIIGETC